MTLQSLSEWLRCPNCFRPVAPTGALSIGCDNGHRFDVNKRGYLSVVGSRKAAGDTATMLDARAAVLEAGAYAPIAGAVVRAAGRPVRVVDAGCGTGYYLRSVLEASAATNALAVDLSPAAVSRTIRSSERIDGLVADIWKPLPIADGAAELVLNVFAPRNLAEFSRILAPDGVLVVVVPDVDHLASLRAVTGMLDVPEDKAETLVDKAAALFDLESSQTIRYELALTPERAVAIAGMGPSAHHARATGAPIPASTTVAVEVLRFARVEAPLLSPPSLRAP